MPLNDERSNPTNAHCHPIINSTDSKYQLNASSDRLANHRAVLIYDIHSHGARITFRRIFTRFPPSGIPSPVAAHARAQAPLQSAHGHADRDKHHLHIDKPGVSLSEVGAQGCAWRHWTSSSAPTFCPTPSYTNTF